MVTAQWSKAVALAVVLLAGCADLGPRYGEDDGRVVDPTDPGSSTPDDGDPFSGPPTVPCDHSITVQSGGPALLVNDPAILARFSLQRVLKQLLDLSGGDTESPTKLLQRLFDTENTAASGVFPDVVHCDSPKNGAFVNGAPTGCPRAEGALAKSAGLLLPGHPDYFVPVALVNRFDLAPSTVENCGEYRIVFAKLSGRTDPSNRLFLIFEGVLPVQQFQGYVMACRPVQQAWASLEKEADPEKIAARLEALYFDGLPGFKPLVHPDNFGLKSNDDEPYGMTRGQVRVSQRMEDPWEMREFHLVNRAAGGSGPPVFFTPATAKNSPASSLFSPTVQTAAANKFRSSFLNEDVQTLAGATLASIRMGINGTFNAGESALSGPAGADYAAQVMSGDSSGFMAAITDRISSLKVNMACPSAEPLTAVDIVNRASIQTCAGCHAPENFVGAEKKIGCGLTWPSTLGGAHIDENGALSAALTDVFLPHRASVVSTFLKACDMNAIQANLQQVGGGAIPK